MTGLTSPIASSAEPRHDQPGRGRALIALAIVAWFPAAVALLPVVGGIIGLTGEGGLVGTARWAILALFYFAPFVVGGALGWSAIRAHARGWVALVGWLGLIGNLVIILISVAFAAGEVIDPH